MTAILVTAFVAITVPLLLNEAGEVSPWLAERVLRWGARRLRAPEKVERYTEEWLADLEQVPGKLTKLLYACGVVAFGVVRLRSRLAWEPVAPSELPFEGDVGPAAAPFVRAAAPAPRPPERTARPVRAVRWDPHHPFRLDEKVVPPVIGLSLPPHRHQDPAEPEAPAATVARPRRIGDPVVIFGPPAKAAPPVIGEG